jgi:hypothetical protein
LVLTTGAVSDQPGSEAARCARRVHVPLASHLMFDADLSRVTCPDDAVPKIQSWGSSRIETERAT